MEMAIATALKMTLTMTMGLAIHQKHDDQCAWQQENSRRETKQVSSKLP